MNRKITSIVLLLSFLGIFIHDMIPHHHHEGNTGGLHATHSQIDIHCTYEKEHQPTDLQCDIANNLLSDSHHECPHHYHNCKIKDFELNTPGRSEIPSHWTKISDSGYHYAYNNFPFNSTCFDIAYFDRAVQIPKLSLKGTISLRAPPCMT